MRRLRVLMSRREISPDRLAGATAVVVDAFLATTTRPDHPGERIPPDLPRDERLQI